MIDSNLDEQQPNTESAVKPEKKETSFKRNLFGNLNSELKQALDSWDNLAQEVSKKKSPDEERLIEVKRILGELKSKLDQFED